VRDQISHLHKTAGKIIVLILGTRWGIEDSGRNGKTHSPNLIHYYVFHQCNFDLFM